MSETIDKILDLAEHQVRRKGYHAVSFRDLADQLGIKSASVHYHFPQKPDLGVALVERYSLSFFSTLDERITDQTKWPEFLKAYISVYRDALNRADCTCLCGILGAEVSGLPEPIANSVSEFFDANVMCLQQAMPEDFSDTLKTQKSLAIVSLLQGAMMLANSKKDHSFFDIAAQELLA
jgi:TetR/AcrR family transcriptional repressor of nem operon